MEKRIFYDGIWKGFEAPEEPTNDEQIADYKMIYAEAKRNALQIINPEIIQESEQFPYDVYKIINDIADPHDYVWPGAWEVDYKWEGSEYSEKETNRPSGYFLSLPEPVKLTPEQAAKVEEGMNLWRGKPESKTMEISLCT